MRRLASKTLVVLWACAGACGSDPPDHGGQGTITPDGTPVITELTGVVQKGPFIRGTSVFVSELDATLAQTGRTFITEITDDTGQFSVRIDGLAGPYAKLTANGYYFDEVLGKLSAAPLTLNALVATGVGDPATLALGDGASAGSVITRSARVNVNVLTDLEAPRVEYLVQQGSAFAAAKSQAQREVLQAFMMALDNAATPSSEALDILHATPADAALLAVSVMLQGYLQVGDLSELLATVGDDLRSDGTLEDTGARALIKNAATLVSGPAVRAHILQRYAALGVTATVGEFETLVTHFRDQAPDAFVSRVTLPAVGAYGPNLLVGTTDERTAGDYSLIVVTPAAQPLRIHCSWLGATPISAGNRVGWFISDKENWTATVFDFATQTQDFTVDDPGRASDIHFMLSSTGSMRVDILEGDAVAQTSSHTLTW